MYYLGDFPFLFNKRKISVILINHIFLIERILFHADIISIRYVNRLQFHTLNYNNNIHLNVPLLSRAIEPFYNLRDNTK
jgi:hypothetical protein